MNGIHAAATGRAGDDAELRYTASGNAVLRFRLAVDDQRGRDRDQTVWLTIDLWDERAEELNGQIKKGQSWYVEGRLREERWTRRDGAPGFGLALSAWRCEPLFQIGASAPRRRQPATEEAGGPTTHPRTREATGNGDPREPSGLDDEEEDDSF